MKLFLRPEKVDGLSLREIDGFVETVAECGYGGIVLPRTGDWEVLRGFCRSAGRYSVELWLRDDTGEISGDFGGEVSSVPSLGPKKLALTDKSGGAVPIWEKDGLAVTVVKGGGLWGSDPFDPDAAEAFLECSYVELRRELRRFLGYELTGVVTSFGAADLPWSERMLIYALASEEWDEDGLFNGLFSPDSGPAREKYLRLAGRLFADTALKPLCRFCKEWGMELIANAKSDIPAAERYADCKTAFVDFDGLTVAQRQRELLALVEKGAGRIAIKTGMYPDFIEKLWCGGALRLGELRNVREEKGLMPENVRSFAFDGGRLIYNPSDADAAAELDLKALDVRCIGDLEGRFYLPIGEKLNCVLSPGGCLLLLSSVENEAEPLPPFLGCGALFGTVTVKSEIVPEFAGWEDNRLPLELNDGRCEFEVNYIGENMNISVEAEDAGHVRLNGHELTESNIGDPDGLMAVGRGILKPGRNVLETDGSAVELRGGFSTDGEALIKPVRPGAGNVREQGLARYDGPLHYEVSLPEDCGGKYLILEGAFGCAAVTVGRRRQPLLMRPCMAPLFGFDSGRTAEIIIFPANDRKDVPFGLNKVNIANVKNPTI